MNTLQHARNELTLSAFQKTRAQAAVCRTACSLVHSSLPDATTTKILDLAGSKGVHTPYSWHLQRLEMWAVHSGLPLRNCWTVAQVGTLRPGSEDSPLLLGLNRVPIHTSMVSGCLTGTEIEKKESQILSWSKKSHTDVCGWVKP